MCLIFWTIILNTFSEGLSQKFGVDTVMFYFSYRKSKDLITLIACVHNSVISLESLLFSHCNVLMKFFVYLCNLYSLLLIFVRETNSHTLNIQRTILIFFQRFFKLCNLIFLSYANSAKFVSKKGFINLLAVKFIFECKIIVGQSQVFIVHLFVKVTHVKKWYFSEKVKNILKPVNFSEIKK